MIRTALSAALATLLLAACGQQPAEPAGTETTAPAAEAAAPAAEAPAALTLEQALAGDWRDPANAARDPYRHPKETLAFFDLAPTQTVVEIWPGGGWYTEILAPYLRVEGKFIGAVNDPSKSASEGAKEYFTKQNQALRDKFAARPDLYDRAELVEIDPAAPVFGAPGSADRVLTFRNVHNWMMAGSVEAMFQGFFDVLKPGGMLGVVEHRAAADVPEGDKSGYVGEDQVIAFATAAGFELVDKSEINANPKDTKDHPNGVWTLPPANRHDAADDAKYQAIGESDRMTLKFVKPEASAPAQ